MHKALLAVVALATAAMIGSLAVGTDAGSDARPGKYVILYSPNTTKAMKAAVVKAGGRVLKANNRIGVATAFSADPRFRARAEASKAIQGVSRNVPIGRARPVLRPKFSEEYMRSFRKLAKGVKIRQSRRSGFRFQGTTPEPLAHLQWDMKMIHATSDRNGSYSKETGKKSVLVGVIDTGVDGNHPDIAPNFDAALSRNFTVDIPALDGPCADEPDGSCNDASNVDENSHGTHVASTIGSPINGLGMAGVAPTVKLVNLRAGQDSGFFFLQPSVDALTYAGDHGVDVVNMSYFIDPWLYNCGNPLNPVPEDTPVEKAEQKVIIDATQRALDYAHQRNVTLVAALGNSRTDVGVPKTDIGSPNPGTAHPRTVNNTCLDLPTEGNNVISVSAIGPSKTKADYSNWSYEETTVAAPGGWFRDTGWTAANPNGGIQNQILAAYPKNVAEESHELNPDGTPNTPFVVRDCSGSTCAYYQWIQGTSMASPHAAGVAALIVSEYGKNGGPVDKISLHPLFTQAYLEASATDTPCMSNQADGTFSYAHVNRPPTFTSFCEGTPEFNGWYGHGIVDAYSAVTIGDQG